MQAAPFFDDVADAPPGGSAFWLEARDGVRLRAAQWVPEEARATVLLFPGRTEYIEKYGPLVAELAAAGHATLAVDWRGQGLSDRLLEDPLSGHVERFADYQLDVAALMDHARRADLPRPFYLLAHSMGGAIGLRALTEGLPAERAAFSAPMWGISLSAGLRPAAWALSWTARRMGLSHLYAPGTSGSNYPHATPFEVNLLTNDEAQYARMARQTDAHPDLALGGPSLGWLNEAMHECDRLASRPSPDTPCVTVLGTEEKVVDSDAVVARMEAWHGGRLLMIEGGRHETLMDTPDRSGQALDAILGLFSADSASAADRRATT